MVRITVTLDIDAESVRDAEKLLDVWLSRAEDDDRLDRYVVTAGKHLHKKRLT